MFMINLQGTGRNKVSWLHSQAEHDYSNINLRLRLQSVLLPMQCVTRAGRLLHCTMQYGHVLYSLSHAIMAT